MSCQSKPFIELFVKAAPSDRNKNGPSMVTQQWFMAMYCLVEKGLIDLRVTPVTFDSVPENYKKLNAARHLPVAWIESGTLGGEDASCLTITSDESFETLMEKLKCRNLNPELCDSDVLAAKKVTENLYIALMQYVKNDTSKLLINVLTNLNDFLEFAQPFVLGNEISLVDCELMPKLQHIRIVAAAYKDFEIPHNLTNVWKYIQLMYSLKSFTLSCPSTRDVLIYYEERNPSLTTVNPNQMGSDILTSIPDMALDLSKVEH